MPEFTGMLGALLSGVPAGVFAALWWVELNRRKDAELKLRENSVKQLVACLGAHDGDPCAARVDQANLNHVLWKGET